MWPKKVVNSGHLRGRKIGVSSECPASPRPESWSPGKRGAADPLLRGIFTPSAGSRMPLPTASTLAQAPQAVTAAWFCGHRRSLGDAFHPAARSDGAPSPARFRTPSGSQIRAAASGHVAMWAAAGHWEAAAGRL